MSRDIRNDPAWAKLGWVFYEQNLKDQKRQKRENFFKWLMLCAAVFTIIVLALVYTNQIP